MSMRLQRCGVLAAALLLIVPAAGAGTIAPRLQAEMDRSAPGTVFSVIVNLTEQAPVRELSDTLQSNRATRMERHRTIVGALQETAARSQDRLKGELDAGIVDGSVIGYTSYWISNLVVVQATKEEIADLATRTDVDLVEPNFTASLIEPVGFRVPDLDRGSPDGGGTGGLRGIGVTPGVRAIRAPEVWYQLGITGAGRIVANLDTGVDGNHPALRDRWRGNNGHPWQECWLDLLGGNTQYPSDGYGHGTHVMGTETGLGAATEDTVGVAWGAQWIACNAINQGVGSEFDNDVITAYQWFADPDGNPETVEDVPDVVQNSWRINESFGYPDCDTRWWSVIDNCEASGCVTTWSAGNEGPGAQTIGSPADRATTTTNALSVGAVDATHYGWPYPIAGFSSRGPTGCDAPPENRIKPEVVAPGVDVYSSVPGGGYSQSWSGTSMAGPHVAGIVGLIREANPNLSVDDVKQILMDTARDEGNAGEDNTYGWGFVDAYDAVIEATTGFGQIEGHVTNASYNNIPIVDATVTLLEIGTDFATDETGYYSGSAPAAAYTVEASHPGFEPDTAAVVLLSGELATQDFGLVDNAGPAISGVTDQQTTTNTTGPYTINATVSDPSTVASVKLFYRVNQGSWYERTMFGGLGGLYTGYMNGQPAGSWIDYYVWAEDRAGLTATEPADAPASTFTLFITTEVFDDDAEQDQGWSLYTGGDNATSGLWVRANPVGTTYGGSPFQPEDDHTPAPGVICFVTGNGTPGGQVGEADVDGGCTTLTTPVFDLTGASQAFLSYHRWFAEEVAYDDEFQIDVSSNGGTTWFELEHVPSSDRTWRKMTRNLAEVVDLTNAVKIRFKACDLGAGSLIEAAIDDVRLEVFTPLPAGADEKATPSLRSDLSQNQPNPFNPVTTIRFRLSNPAEARLEIYDTSGRQVRVLVDGPLSAGAHEIIWNGLDDLGHAVGSGVYFYRLKAGAFEQSRRMTILK